MTESTDDPDRLVVECPECSGVGSTVRRCTCVYTGNIAVVSSDGGSDARREPFADCALCGGSGTVSRTCHVCQSEGRIRAQIVVTAVNVDTGRVASSTVIPGVPGIERNPVTGKSVLPLDRVIAETLDRVEASWNAPETGRHTAVHVPGTFTEEHGEDRWRAEAASIARRHLVGRHTILIGRSSPPPTPTDADAVLERFRRLADLLCVDLVVWRRATEAIRGGREVLWWIALRLPDDPLPVESPVDRPDDLATVLLRTTEDDLLRGLTRALRPPAPTTPAPARYLRTDSGIDAASTTSPMLVSELERTLIAADDTGDGALAVWRDRRWHVSAIVNDGVTERTVFAPTGQIYRRSRQHWRPAEWPPAPLHWGDPITESLCSQCETGTAWEPCGCTIRRDEPDRDCRHCAGSGQRQSLYCGACGGVGRQRDGFVVTVSDLDSFSVHIDFRPEKGGDAVWTVTDDGLGFYRLPAFALSTLLFEASIDSADVRELDGRPIDRSLLAGTVSAPATSTAPEVATLFCRKHSRLPGARRFLRVSPPRTDTVDRLARIAIPLGFDVLVVCTGPYRDPSITSSGIVWGVIIVPRDAEVDRTDIVTAGRERYLSAAVTTCLDGLEATLSRRYRPGALDPVPAPQQDVPLRFDADGLAEALERLVTGLDDDPPRVTVRISAASVTVTRHFSGLDEAIMPVSSVVLAEGQTVAEALAALRR